MAKSMENFKNSLETEFNDNKVIMDASHIGTTIISKGLLFWKKESILISGRVNREVEQEEVNKIIESRGKKIEIKSTLRVEQR